MKSFLSDRPRVPGPVAQPPAPPSAFAVASSGAAPRAHPAHGGSTVECVREGDRITRLVVTCPCGERIEIECLYGGHA